jgi:serine/threonine protein kinase
VKIKNLGSGVHSREVKGIERLQNALPDNWLAFTNLEFVMSAGKSREIDVVLISPTRLFIIDLKDWNGQVVAKDGAWFQNGSHRGKSPVGKITENARNIGLSFEQDIKKHQKSQKITAPFVHGLVVFTGNCDISKLAPAEREKVLKLDSFVSIVTNDKRNREVFGNVPSIFLKEPLISGEWKHRINQFFNVSKGNFEPGQKRFAEFMADEKEDFEHAQSLYKEFLAHSTTSDRSFGTLRLWDFTKAEARFQNEEARMQIAGREKRVSEYIRDFDEDFESYSLQTKAEDIEYSPDYWEVFDRRQGLERLSEILPQTIIRKPKGKRIELSKQLLSRVAKLHLNRISHLDLGLHSVWFQEPGQVKISHFMSAAIPDQETLGASRYQFLSVAKTPEEVMGVESSRRKKDVFLLGLLVHKLLFGKLPDADEYGLVEWSETKLESSDCEEFHSWFEIALAHEPKKRFHSAVEALEKFTEATEPVSWHTENLKDLESFKDPEISSPFNLYVKYPPDGQPITDNSEKTIWKSKQDEKICIVKTWKSACWDTINTDGFRILQFLNAIKELQSSNIDCIPAIQAIHWLDEQIAIVSDYVEGETLGDIISAEEVSNEEAKSISIGLLKAVIMLHDRGIYHGDLNPANVILPEIKVNVKLIDLVDFGHTNDGERVTGAYSLEHQTPILRDRFACFTIIKKLLGKSSLLADYKDTFNKLEDKINDDQCLVGLLTEITRPKAKYIPPFPSNILIDFYWNSANKVPEFIPDEGNYYFRNAVESEFRGQKEFKASLRGANSELVINFDKHKKVTKVRFYPLKQSNLEWNKKFEIGTFKGQLKLRHSENPSFESLENLIKNFNIFDKTELKKDSYEEIPSKQINETSASDQRIDDLEQLVAQQVSRFDMTNSRDIWKQLIDFEEEAITLGTCIEESEFNTRTKQIVFSCEITARNFEYARGDSVKVESYIPKSDRWAYLGELDLSSSTNDLVVVSANNDKTIYPGTKLRFISRFEETSFNRRRTATMRLLDKQAANTAVSSVLFGELEQPFKQNVDKESLSEAADKYGLNDTQKNGLETILSSLPVGIIQGPPGTGKTKFIAALVHYALKEGLAKNVLISSQSHEAVNNAADAVIENFDSEQLELLRVGREGKISGQLKKFGSDRIIDAKKAVFNSDLETKLGFAKKFFDIPKNVSREILNLEGYLPRLATKFFDLLSLQLQERGWTEKYEVELERTTSHLRKSLTAYHLEYLFDDIAIEDGAIEFIKIIRSEVAVHYSISQIEYNRLVNLHEFITDYKNSISVPERNFEAFLAATKTIVAGTCVGLGKASLGLTTTSYDLVVIDEAARCTPSELAVPLQTAKWVVLVGDQAQLEPLHDAMIVKQTGGILKISEREVIASDFEKLLTSPYGQAASGLLSTQYRMLPPIGDLVSNAFYNGKLNSGREMPLSNWDETSICFDKPCSWIDTDELGSGAFDETYKSSRINKAEATAIVNLIRSWDGNASLLGNLAKTGYEFPVGIICMYSAQKNFLRREMANSGISSRLRQLIKIDTVDSYQGKENPIVIVSLVRNNTRGGGSISQGFLARPNRINVAMSRARDRLIIVGSRDRWPNGSPLYNLGRSFSDLERTDNARTIVPSVVINRLQEGA